METIRESTHRLGDLRFGITGNDPVAPFLRSEFRSVAEEIVGEPHLWFNFVDSVVPPAGSIQVQSLHIAGDSFYAEHSGYRYRVWSEGGTIGVDIKSGPLSWKQRLAPDWLTRFVDWNYLTPHETLAKNFVYDIFDYLSQIAQLPLGQSYLHASALERDGVGLVLAGWGGVGKTSSMLKLVLEDGWRYLSDDLVVVDRCGRLWRSPKNMQVYAYNLLNQPRIQSALLERRAKLDLFSWHYRRWRFGPRGVRRRVSPEALLGEEKIAAQAALTHALFLERADTSSFETVSITPRQAAELAAMTLLKELQPLVDLSVAMHSSNAGCILPRVMSLHEESAQVLEAGFNDVRPFVIRVPLSADPDDVANFISTLVVELQ